MDPPVRAARRVGASETPDVTSERARRARIADSALQLRESVLSYLGSRDPGASRDALLAGSPDAWTFLLRVECCALPLVRRLRDDGTLERLDDAARARLQAAEASELQRVLAARLLIRELETVGERAGLRFTLLKGGAVAADPAQPPLDLGDVDALVSPESTERAWSTLLANGWTPAPGGLDPDDELGTRPHFAPLRSERHQLPLELHARFDYGAANVEPPPETTPIAGYRFLDRLAGPRAVAAALRHSVVAHPHRRGHLRDLFLLCELLRDLDESQLGEIERDLKSDPESVELLAMLAQARALARREPLADPDVLRPFVRFKYAVAARTSRLLDIRSPGWHAWSHVMLERPPVRRATYRRLVLGATDAIHRDWSPLRDPLLGSSVARSVGLPRLVRLGRRVALVLALVALGGAIRRHVTARRFAPKGVD